jgi:8-oxo-dGTP diphosphatase
MDQNLSRLGGGDRGEPPWQATNSAGYPSPAALAVDVVVMTVHGEQPAVLALDRGDGSLALPGGFVGPQETPAQTAARKLHEKTGLERLYLEQLATFADPGRDPRGWIPTVAHLALVPADTQASDPAARWIHPVEHPPLAFDHDQIVALALERVQGKLWWSNVAVGILPTEFTLAQARGVYEALADTLYDPASFARDLRATGLIAPTGEMRRETGGRPAQLYRFVDHQPAWGAGRRKRVAPPAT